MKSSMQTHSSGRKATLMQISIGRLEGDLACHGQGFKSMNGFKFETWTVIEKENSLGICSGFCSGLVGIGWVWKHSSFSDSALMLLLTDYIHEDRDAMPRDCAKGNREGIAGLIKGRRLRTRDHAFDIAMAGCWLYWRINAQLWLCALNALRKSII